MDIMEGKKKTSNIQSLEIRRMDLTLTINPIILQPLKITKKKESSGIIPSFIACAKFSTWDERVTGVGGGWGRFYNE